MGSGKPRTKQGHLPTIGARPANDRPGNRLPRVLYVDGDAEKRLALEGGLRGHVGIMAVATVEEARRLARIIRFDAVVLSPTADEVVDTGRILDALSARSRVPVPMVLTVASGESTTSIAHLISRAVGKTVPAAS